jgi:predicted nucleotidyltransferase component of viral defense system
LNAPQPDSKLIEAIAIDLGVDPSFIEKDWHAMRLAGLLAAIKHPTLTLVFSGGTSLSKGYGLISRFSEDLDFKVIMAGGKSEREDWRKLRDQITEAITQSKEWTIKDTTKTETLFRCLVSYTNSFKHTSALRPDIQLDINFLPIALSAEKRPLQSFVSQALKQPPEAAAMDCVTPVETAADKLSALTWRVLTRDRASAKDDPTIIRHLHDLAALEQLALKSADFAPLLASVLEADIKRGKPPADIAALGGQGRMKAALKQLKDDKAYTGEYEQFVSGMSYAREGETPSFPEALKALQRLIEYADKK